MAARCLLRDPAPDDLPILFEHQRDAGACAMAAFPSRDHDAFFKHWAKILGDPTLIKKTITVDGAVAGHIGSFQQDGKQEVGYWLGREYWGQGLATAAIQEFLTTIETRRPLYAHVAEHNLGSIRALEKCGFRQAGRIADFSESGGTPVAGVTMILE